MKRIAIGLLASLLTLNAANAAGWGSVHLYVKPTGKCAGQEVLASHYSVGTRTANGERFDANGNTAAARTWPLGTTLTVTNPHNGRSLTVRINDTGPWGIAYKNGRSLTVRINDTGPWGIAYAQGARLDLARGAAQRLGMRGAQYVCVA
ncbi:MAG: hypothetical protein HY244_01105 [Rhizobiales bacterium]|nr:hypothetical protein [Hyphomicrobiales bacterium]